MFRIEKRPTLRAIFELDYECVEELVSKIWPNEGFYPFGLSGTFSG